MVFEVLKVDSFNDNSPVNAANLIEPNHIETIEHVPVEILENLLDYLEKTDILCAANVCILWKQICQRLLRERCLVSIPSDILTEILAEQEGGEDSLRLWRKAKEDVRAEEEGAEMELKERGLDKVDWVGVWYKWVESHIGFDGEEGLRCGTFSNQNQAVITAWASDGDEVYVGYNEGQLKCYSCDDPRGRLELEDVLSKEPVDDIAIVPSQGVVISATDDVVQFHPTLKEYQKTRSDHNEGSTQRLWKEMDTEWDKELRIKRRICLGKRKQISVFGHRFTVISPENNLEIYEISVGGDRLSTNRLGRIYGCEGVMQWKLWQESVIILLFSGEVAIYSIKGHPELVYKSEPYGVIMYKNPCWIYRDVVFCSTLTSGRLIVRTSYWLVGWDIGRRGRLCRALDQDKVNPTEDIWCIALRRKFLVCGTDWGRINLFQLDRAENTNGHSIVDLDMTGRGNPVFSKKVGKGPVMQVDLAFQNGAIVIYYKTSDNQLFFLKIDSMLCDRYIR